MCGRRKNESLDTAWHIYLIPWELPVTTGTSVKPTRSFVGHLMHADSHLPFETPYGRPRIAVEQRMLQQRLHGEDLIISFLKRKIIDHDIKIPVAANVEVDVAVTIGHFEASGAGPQRGNRQGRYRMVEWRGSDRKVSRKQAGTAPAAIQPVGRYLQVSGGASRLLMRSQALPRENQAWPSKIKPLWLHGCFSARLGLHHHVKWTNTSMDASYIVQYNVCTRYTLRIGQLSALETKAKTRSLI